MSRAVPHRIARAAMTAFMADGITGAAIQRTRRRTGGVSSPHARDARTTASRCSCRRRAARKMERCWKSNAAKLIAALKGG